MGTHYTVRIATMYDNYTSPVTTLAEAAAIISQYVADMGRRRGVGASAMLPGFGDVVSPTGRTVARVSYNGRVWPPGKWKPGVEAIEGAKLTALLGAKAPSKRKKNPPTENDFLALRDALAANGVEVRRTATGLTAKLAHGGKRSARITTSGFTGATFNVQFSDGERAQLNTGGRWTPWDAARGLLDALMVTKGQEAALARAHVQTQRNPRVSGPYSVQVLHATGGYTNKFFGVKLPEARKAFRAACDAYAHDPTKEVLLTGYKGTEKVTIEGCGRGWKKNPSASPARAEFNAAFRAHRAWENRKIPIAEYNAATFRKGMPALHAETAYRSARDWRSDTPKRLTWKRDSKGLLDAYIGAGNFVTVGPAPAWTRDPGRAATGFVAAVDYHGIAASPRYIDTRGDLGFGTVVGRAIVYPTEAAARLAASRYLLRKQRQLAGKTVGAQLPRSRS